MGESVILWSFCQIFCLFHSLRWGTSHGRKENHFSLLICPSFYLIGLFARINWQGWHWKYYVNSIWQRFVNSIDSYIIMFKCAIPQMKRCHNLFTLQKHRNTAPSIFPWESLHIKPFICFKQQHFFLMVF